MKTQIVITTLLIGLCAAGCKKLIPGNVEKDPSFNATLDASVINVNDSASFSFTDNPDLITFYSGELGNVYENRERTILTGGALNMKFETRVVNKPADTLDVMVSTNFNGSYDSASVASATWKRMTGRFKFPDTATVLGTYVSSGNTPGDFINIDDSVIAGQPFYLAFLYNVTKQNNIQWSVGKLGMYNVFSNGNPNATVLDSLNNNSGSFAEVIMGSSVSRWSTTSSLYKYVNSTAATLGAQYWYISKPLNPDAVKPDEPTATVKNITAPAVAKFKYQYKAPGTYKATIVASYSRLNYQKTFVKEFTIEVQ